MVHRTLLHSTSRMTVRALSFDHCYDDRVCLSRIALSSHLRMDDEAILVQTTLHTGCCMLHVRACMCTGPTYDERAQFLFTVMHVSVCSVTCIMLACNGLQEYVSGASSAHMFDPLRCSRVWLDGGATATGVRTCHCWVKDQNGEHTPTITPNASLITLQ